LNYKIQQTKSKAIKYVIRKTPLLLCQDEFTGAGSVAGVSGGATEQVSRAANISHVLFEGSYPTVWVQIFGLCKLIICLKC
jgi:hypothetical protein